MPSLIGAVLLCAIAIGIFVSLGSDGSGKLTGDSGAQPSQTGKPAVLERSTPDYKTLLPAGKTIDQLGGWTRISPPDRDPAYVYVDTLSGIQINVSQQPLPKEFKRETADKVAQMAKSYGADQIAQAGSTRFHIGTSAKGPQSVIFSRSGLLVLIKSNAPITTEDWAKYISSLE